MRHISIRGDQGMSLIELLVGAVVFLVILGLMVAVTNQTSQAVLQSTDSSDQFQGAGVAMDGLSRNLAMATLFARPEFLQAGGEPARDWGDVPERLGTASDLYFVSGPAADLGLPGEALGHGVFFQCRAGDSRALPPAGRIEHGLVEIGYALLRNTHSDAPGAVANSPKFRLVEFRKSPDEMTAYRGAAEFQGDRDTTQMIAESLSQMTYWTTETLADDVVAFVVEPLKTGATGDWEPLSPNTYFFNSMDPPPGADAFLHRLPEALRVTMVVANAGAMERIPDFDPIAEAPFNNPANYEEDLDNLVAELETAKIPHRVFSSIIRPWEAKGGE